MAEKKLFQNYYLARKLQVVIHNIFCIYKFFLLYLHNLMQTTHVLK